MGRILIIFLPVSGAIISEVGIIELSPLKGSYRKRAWRPSEYKRSEG